MTTVTATERNPTNYGTRKMTRSEVNVLRDEMGFEPVLPNRGG